MNTESHQTCIDACNSLLRGELSAVETYTQALAKVEAPSARIQLETIRSEHQQSARTLHDHVLSMHGKPSTESGAWGMFARAVEGGAKLFGESAAIKALEEGEEHGIREYRDTLGKTGVMEEIKGAIRSELLPRLEDHVGKLRRLRAA